MRKKGSIRKRFLTAGILCWLFCGAGCGNEQQYCTPGNKVVCKTGDVVSLINEECEKGNEAVKEKEEEREASEKAGETVSMPDAFAEVEAGDFTNVEIDEEKYHFGREGLTDAYERAKAGTEYMLVWKQCDVDGDGVLELVWQMEDEEYGIQRIEYIFAYLNEKVECIYSDLNDMTAYLFVAENGNLVYTCPYYGVYVYENYEQCILDAQGKKVKQKALEIYDIYSMEELEPEWVEKHPNMEQPGVYYKKSYLENAEAMDIPGCEEEWIEEWISEEDFQKEYKELLGKDYGSTEDSSTEEE